MVTAIAPQIFRCFPDIDLSPWSPMTSFGGCAVNKVTWVTSSLRKLEAVVPPPLFFSLNDIAMLEMNNSKVADEIAYIGIYIRCTRDKQSSIVLMHWDCLCYSSLHYLLCMIQHLYSSCFSSLGCLPFYLSIRSFSVSEGPKIAPPILRNLSNRSTSKGKIDLFFP